MEKQEIKTSLEEIKTLLAMGYDETDEYLKEHFDHYISDKHFACDFMAGVCVSMLGHLINKL